MSKKILVLVANPKKESFTRHLAEVYANAADKHNEVKILHIANMEFDPDLSNGYTESHDLEDSLIAFQKAVTWSDHLVIFTPIWWGSVPAKFKGLIDRAFLPGFAFQYEKGKTIPKKLLKGRTARIVMTMDTPPWYYQLVQGAPAVKQLKRTTLKFVGFHSVKSKMIGPVINSKQSSREKWANDIAKLGHIAN
ncbi:NAD(P)H-dependent oxidoreductase [Marinomonas colpomeniae]|uniref:NAD(P)H-dependent oxidoreductase n=1 Tax=Marinomonas colpomeniae TaxID=2774408 RepID=A0ABR8NWR3_9GAMM|nr:NAD(P)H-dependent oxidoreductase [Marinomonas colpomeniae]MBD5770338.1 NAD(P)H-dependent oxidoreductase [Marinomonas colpomeniae]